MATVDFDDFHGGIGALVRLLEPGWTKDAACREHPEFSWFPGRGDSDTSATEARQVCVGCAVRLECLRYALADETLAGVWGGTSAQQRARARRDGLDAAGLLAELAARTIPAPNETVKRGRSRSLTVGRITP